MSISKEWWVDEQGRNNLAGIPGSVTNPAILPDYLIVDLLLINPAAKESFRRMVPLMLPDEQERLNGLVAKNPRTMKNYPIDDQVLGDQSMRAISGQGYRDPNRRRK